MPQYEKYEGESQEAADARIAKNKQVNPRQVAKLDAKEHHSRNRRESNADREMSYAYTNMIHHDTEDLEKKRGRSVNSAMKVIDAKKEEEYNRLHNPEWAEEGVRQERGEYTGGGRQEKSYATMLKEEGHDVYDKQFKYLISNSPEDSEMNEIIGWDDGRYEVGLYAVRTKDGVKFVGGDTDRYHGYGPSGNPKYESSADAKYGSARHQVGKEKFLSYDEAFKIYKRQAKREKPGIAEKVMSSLSDYFTEDGDK